MARKKGVTESYDRGLIIFGTVTGHVKLWDITHCLKQKALSRPYKSSKLNMLAAMKTSLNLTKNIVQKSDDSAPGLISLEEVPKAAYKEKISYNPMRRLTTTLPQAQATTCLA